MGGVTIHRHESHQCASSHRAPLPYSIAWIPKLSLFPTHGLLNCFPDVHGPVRSWFCCFILKFRRRLASTLSLPPHPLYLLSYVSHRVSSLNTHRVVYTKTFYPPGKSQGEPISCLTRTICVLLSLFSRRLYFDPLILNRATVPWRVLV